MSMRVCECGCAARVFVVYVLHWYLVVADVKSVLLVCYTG